MSGVLASPRDRVAKIRVREGPAEVLDRLPHRIVHEQVAIANGPMELRRDESRLFLYPQCVLRPGPEQGVDVHCIKTFIRTTGDAATAG